MATFPGFGRIFDFAAQACERSFPQVTPVLRQARLFCFPHEPVGTLPTEHSRDEVEFWSENFALPYPITAIEDTQGLVIVWDADILQPETWADTVRKALAQPGVSSLAPMLACEEPQRGLGAYRFFLDIIPSWSMRDREEVLVPFTNDDLKSAVIGEDGQYYAKPLGGVDFVTITLGVCTFDNAHERGIVGHVTTMGMWSLTKKRRIFATRGGRADNDVLDRSQRVALQNVRTAFEEIMWFNDPDRFVVEETREQGPRPKHMKGKIKRAKERPTYHSWTPLDIRRIRGGNAVDSEGEPIKRRGHWRRGHFRTLRAARYARSGMQGKTVLVRPTFVGDPAFSVERSHYRILLGEDEVLVGQQQPREELA
jgi:hypothetical protein